MRAIGIDVVDVERFQKAIERWGDRFVNKILTPQEVALCRNKSSTFASMAVRFAAKEAFIKCLSPEEYRHFRWHAIEILNNESGRPFIRLSSSLKKCFTNHTLFISLTHSQLTAAAVVAIE